MAGRPADDGPRRPADVWGRALERRRWAGWYSLVLVARRTPPEYLAYLQREEIPYLVAGEERVVLA